MKQHHPLASKSISGSICGLLCAVAAVGLVACGKTDETKQVAVDQHELVDAVNGDLHTAEKNCVAMPVHFDEPVAKDYAKLQEPNGAQLDALVKVGLIKTSPADGGNVTFSLTDVGKESYAGLAAAAMPGFCGGNVEVDKITEDKVLEERSNYRRHQVSYQYKFNTPAAWQTDAAVKAAFPKFAEFVDQAGKQALQTQLLNRGQGWNVIDANGR